jgi:hypothetical protein
MDNPKLLGRMEAREFWYKSPNCPHTQPSKLKKQDFGLGISLSKLQKASFYQFIRQTFTMLKLLPNSKYYQCYQVLQHPG